MGSTSRVPARATPLQPCLNCGDPAPGFYCPTCGQRKLDVRVSMWSMLREVLDDQFSLSAAFPRTLAALCLAPGKLTEEYVRGRIVRYVPPFRLYLVASIVFFVTLSLVEEDALGVGEVTLPPAGAEAAPDAPAERADSAGWLGLEIQEDDGRLEAWAKRRVMRLNAMEPEAAGRAVAQGIRAHLPTGVFLLVPAFALLLGRLYLDRRHYFVEHLVFALHLHAAGFLLMTISRLLEAALDAPWVGLVSLLLLLLYLFLALRRVYSAGRGGTGVRLVLLLVSWGMSLLIVLVGVVAVSVLLV